MCSSRVATSRQSPGARILQSTCQAGVWPRLRPNSLSMGIHSRYSDSCHCSNSYYPCQIGGPLPGCDSLNPIVPVSCILQSAQVSFWSSCRKRYLVSRIRVPHRASSRSSSYNTPHLLPLSCSCQPHYYPSLLSTPPYLASQTATFVRCILVHPQAAATFE
jgi:hypothetical protein